MIKKYKKIGALLLGLSCLTGGFFTTVENNSLIPTVQAAEQTDKLVCNMTTKELFNVVYGYLREEGHIITFAMPPQSADDYGLITIRGFCTWYRSSKRSASVQGRMYINLYIDKGSSRDFSILNIVNYFGDYNYLFDYIRYSPEGFSRQDAYSPSGAADMDGMVEGFVDYHKKSAEKWVQTLYMDLSARVKRASSSMSRESSSVQRESASVQNESTSAPSRSKER